MVSWGNLNSILYFVLLKWGLITFFSHVSWFWIMVYHNFSFLLVKSQVFLGKMMKNHSFTSCSKHFSFLNPVNIPVFVGKNPLRSPSATPGQEGPPAGTLGTRGALVQRCLPHWKPGADFNSSPKLKKLKKAWVSALQYTEKFGGEDGWSE